MMLYPETRFLLLLTIPMKMRWMISSLLLLNILVLLGERNYIEAVANLGGGATGYFYGLIAWNLHGPFPKLHLFEEPFLRFGVRSRRIYESMVGGLFARKRGSGIYDITDEAFLDAALEKIAKVGRSALTWRERLRLWLIARRQRRG